MLKEKNRKTSWTLESPATPEMVRQFLRDVDPEENELDPGEPGYPGDGAPVSEGCRSRGNRPHRAGCQAPCL
jgi:hypothetical protein